MKMVFSNPDLPQLWKDYFNHYRAVTHSAKVDYDKSCDFNMKTGKINKAIHKEIAKLANFSGDSIVSEAVQATSPQALWATYAVVNSLIDMVIPDVIIDEFGQFAEIRNLNWGDNAVFDIKSSDLFFVTKNGNARRHVTAQRQFTGQISLTPTNRTITTNTDLYRVLAGKESFAEFAYKMALSMAAEIGLDMYAALSGAYSSLASSFKEAAFTQEAWMKLRNRVAAANGGGRVYAIGTDIALSNILPNSDYLKVGLGETYNAIGYLPVYMGTPCLALNQKIQWDSSDYSFALADDEIFFIHSTENKLLKVVFEGETLSFVDAMASNANLTMNNSMHKRWATGIVTNSKFGIMKIGS